MAFINSSEIVDSSAYSVSGRSQFYAGLDKCILDLRRLLFPSEVSVVGLQCMGGGGKTTLASALCNDPQIKEYFRDNVIFITVSQSSNLNGITAKESPGFQNVKDIQMKLRQFILSQSKPTLVILEKIGGEERPAFRNLRDARSKLQQLISNQSMPTLVILDDVWSREDLENLLFERLRYKTIVTTRDDSFIPTTATTGLYQVASLCREDALSRSRLSAFGQPSNPSICTVHAIIEKLIQYFFFPIICCIWS